MTNLKRFCFLFLCGTVLCGPSVTWAQTAPANDNFGDAAVITGDTGTTNGNNFAATAEAGEPDYVNVIPPQACASVWYQWTAPSDGEYYFNTFGSDFDTILAVYAGMDFPIPQNQLAANDDYSPPNYSQSRLSFVATAGTTYHLAVDGWDCDQGYIALNWGPASQLPANDDFALAAAISGDTGTAAATTINATPEISEPIHHVNNVDPYSSIWFAWTAPPAGGNFFFDTMGSDFDTILAVYASTGPNFTDLTELASNDDVGSVLQSRVAFTATGSEIYHIAVDGYAGLQGNVILNWQMLQAPPNDDFASATVISGQTGTTSAYNFLATPETGEPPHGETSHGPPPFVFVPPYASIWFTWTAPFSGKAAFDTFGSDFDTTMAAYTGSAVDSLNKLRENDDAGTDTRSRITFPVVTDSTYYIAVDGFEGDVGNVTLNWQKNSSWILFLPAVIGTGGP